jgi:hypothetical protein
MLNEPTRSVGHVLRGAQSAENAQPLAEAAWLGTAHRAILRPAAILPHAIGLRRRSDAYSAANRLQIGKAALVMPRNPGSFSR